MIEKIRPNFFRIEIPLPNSPLKTLNSYVIRSAERNLIVDTGLNRDECLDAMQAGLNELNLELAKTDFFITHLHADHFGLIGRLATDTSIIYFNRPETELIEAWGGWAPMIDYAGKNGYPQDDLRAALESHPGHKFASDWVPETSVVDNGDEIRVGEYLLKCVFTPGHSKGHMCLYEPDQKILIAGDHILGDITPNIQCWSDTDNPLKNYLKSLDKVRQLDIELTLPAHRRLLKNPDARIKEIIGHHNSRLNEVVTILDDGPQHAYQVASRMTWDLDADSWDAFPQAQKWFATGEAIAHLRYLEEEGQTTRELKDNVIRYNLV
jgi:glyoxylase-like metal-dependent hydrolase (beta-lactamase superfamily II)